MADAQGGIGAIFKLSARPQLEIVQKHDQTVDIEPESLSSRVYVGECTNCQVVLKKKPAKVVIEKCQDLFLTMSVGLVSGTLEVLNSSNISITVNQGIKIPTIMADSTTGLEIILLENEQQLESLYFHQSSNMTITVGSGVEKKQYVATPSTDENRQFISHWQMGQDGIQLITEKVVREGVYPYAEKALEEAREKDRQNAEKAFATLEKEFFKIRPKK